MIRWDIAATLAVFSGLFVDLLEISMSVQFAVTVQIHQSELEYYEMGTLRKSSVYDEGTFFFVISEKFCTVSQNELIIDT